MGFKVGKSSAISDDGDQNSIIVHSRNVRDSCLHTIDEQKAGIDESDWESKEEYVAAVLANCKRTWFESLKYHLGYPLEYNVEYGSLSCLQPFPINNFGDPFMESNYGVNSKDFEVWVLDWFARLWEIQKDEYWGYVTHGGTEANLQALLMARGMFPDGIVYTSKESHFSIFKAAWMFRMNCIEIETLITGEIDCEDLKNKLYKNKDKPAIINLNIGTTFKGAVDDVDMVTKTLEECAFPRNKYYIHCDGALAGLILPFVEQAPQMTFKKPIDSINVSGHKLLACPMPCGILITRINHIDPLSTNIEYIASRYATISCSRNGHTPIFLWYMLSRKGHTGLQQDVQRCLQNARYLQTRLMDAGISVMLNQLSNIVVFERPPDQEFIRKWQLSCQGNIAHVVVMFNMSKEKLDDFIHELIKKRSSWFKDGNSQLPCVANDIGEENCVCPLHTT